MPTVQPAGKELSEFSRSRLSFVLLALTLCGGCVVMSESECLNADWREVGRNDGLEGKRAEELGRYKDACLQYGVTPDDSEDEELPAGTVEERRKEIDELRGELKVLRAWRVVHFSEYVDAVDEAPSPPYRSCFIQVENSIGYFLLGPKRAV